MPDTTKKKKLTEDQKRQASARVSQKKYDAQMKRLSGGGKLKVDANREKKLYESMGKPYGVMRSTDLDYSSAPAQARKKKKKPHQ